MAPVGVAEGPRVRRAARQVVDSKRYYETRYGGISLAGPGRGYSGQPARASEQTTMSYRRTLKQPVGCTGIGLHSAKPVRLRLPALRCAAGRHASAHTAYLLAAARRCILLSGSRPGPPAASASCWPVGKGGPHLCLQPGRRQPAHAAGGLQPQSPQPVPQLLAHPHHRRRPALHRGNAQSCGPALREPDRAVALLIFPGRHRLCLRALQAGFDRVPPCHSRDGG